MEVTLYRADPAGNITLLVTSPVPADQRAAVANKLLALPELQAEQVGFFVPPRQTGQARLEMMGGEFCGNALRSAGFLTAKLRGQTGMTAVSMEISGCDVPLQVRADLELGEATAEVPLPVGVEDVRLLGLKLGVVAFDGIVHAVCEGRKPDRELANQVTRALAARYGASAAGLLFLRYEDGFVMDPAVYVPATDTLYFENSCASGTAAAACYLSDGEQAGAYAYAIRQPGGTLKASAIRADGELLTLTVGGPLTIAEAMTLEL